jgi:hypothetical protein
VPPESNDSGKLVQRILDLATGRVEDIADHLTAIDICLRGDTEGKVRGMIARMDAIEKSCRQNHGSDQRLQIQMDTNRMEVPPAPPARPPFWRGVSGRFLIVCALIALGLLAVIFNAKNLGELCGSLLLKLTGQ